MRWISMIFLASVCITRAASGAEVYYAHGYHGGYFLTDERGYGKALDDVFRLLDAAPGYKVLWELEPYTLERMAGGEQFACERRGRTEAELSWWALSPRGAASTAARSQEAAHAGQWGLRLVLDEKRPYVHGCQPLPAIQLRGRRLAFTGWARTRAAAGAHLYVDAHDDRGVIPGSAQLSTFAPADGQWHQLILEFTVPKGARAIFPQAKIVHGPGEADFDDLSLRDVQNGSELLANGGFEELDLPNLKMPGYLEKLRGSIASGRAEIVGGPYTQPIMYTIGAESVIRQFTYGCRAVQETLGRPVRFYAAQEPDMVAQLPQLLSQLGFEGALFRTHWCIFGSPPHLDAESAWWIGPDGSRIPTVPAYAGAPMRGYGLPGPSPQLVARLEKASIHRPLFSGLADLVVQDVPNASWPALHATAGNHFTTLADYFGRLGQPTQTWEDPYKDFEHRFPWGLLAGRPQRDDRMAENAVLQTERLFAIANRDPGGGLDDAWRLTLLAQHHDAWVCAPAIFGIWKRGYQTYAELTHEADRESLAACSQLQSTLLKTPGRSFVIVNTSSVARRALTPIACVLPAGLVGSPLMCNAAGRSVPASFTVVSRHDDRTVREIQGTALVEIPPLGYRRYEIREGVSPPLPTARTESQGKQIVLANDAISVTVSPDGLLQVSDAKGGPLLAAPAFLAGAFPEGEQRSTVESVGRGREGVDLTGRVGSVPFRATVTLDPLEPLVRLSLELDFGEKTLVGASENREPRLPSFAQDEQKLRLVLPLKTDSPRFCADGAFEIRSVTRPRWPVLHYAAAEGNGRVVAVFTDRATAGLFSPQPGSLAMVLGYGGPFLYAPGHAAPLRGPERFEFRLLFREGGLASAGLPEAAETLAHPLLVSGNLDAFPQPEFSLVKVEPAAAAIITAACREKKSLVVRLWRPWPGDETVRLKIVPARRTVITNLLGQAQSRPAKGPECTLPMHFNQVVTLRGEL